ncbi:MAG TPA: hypothetical protein VEF04_07320 [Blastocatellia bacterium]|nr:hypothetical protein [Blastocatellia bacterium]
MTEELLNVVMNDGSRRFGELPQTVLADKLRDHIERLDGVIVTSFVTDNVTEAWIDFTYCGHRFSINDQFGYYWFFVDTPDCPDEILKSILFHCKELLGERKS